MVDGSWIDDRWMIMEMEDGDGGWRIALSNVITLFVASKHWFVSCFIYLVLAASIIHHPFFLNEAARVITTVAVIELC